MECLALNETDLRSPTDDVSYGDRSAEADEWSPSSTLLLKLCTSASEGIKRSVVHYQLQRFQKL